MKTNFLSYLLLCIILLAGFFNCYSQIGTIPSEPMQYYYSDDSESHFGEHVWSGGDLNGDGFEDVVAWQIGYSPWSVPTIYLFFGTPSGFSLTPDWLYEVPSSSFLDIDISGDYNNDGYDDLVLGMYNHSTNCFYGSATGPGSVPNWTKTVTEIQFGSTFGKSVANAGDVNNDGFDDLIVGAPLYDNGQDEEGMAFLFPGSASGISLTYTWSKDNNKSGSSFGEDVSGIGDINGDGYDDISIGAIGFDESLANLNTGRVYVYTGSPAYLSASSLWVANGNEEQYIGFDMQNGDFNGDENIDILVAGNNCVKVFYGNGTSFETSPSFEASTLLYSPIITTGNINGDAYDDFITTSYNNGWVGCTGAYEYSGLSAAVFLGTAEGIFPDPVWNADINNENCPEYTGAAFTQDLNGDGKDEFYLGDGEYEEDATDTEKGALILYSGGDFQFPLLPDWQYSPETNAGDNNYGYLTDITADVNGDGFNDMSVAHRYSDGVDIYYGDLSMISTTWDETVAQSNIVSFDCSGDFNNDGYTDCLIGDAYTSVTGINTNDGKAFLYLGSATGVASVTAWTYGGSTPFDYLGWMVSNLGDINNDGFDDAAVSAPYKEHGSTDEGYILIFTGMPTGLSTTPFNILECDQDYAYFGSKITGAGDVNGDGFDDMLVGVPNYDVSCVDDGATFLFYGSSLGFTDYPNWVSIGSDCGDQNGFGIAGDMDINADGYSDIIIGNPYAYTSASTDGRADIYLGHATGPNDLPELNFHGESIDDNLGYTVSSAGDYNVDGYDDFLIGSPSYNYGSNPQGTALLYFGKHNSSDITNFSARIYRATHNTNFASVIEGGGDINGDGADDIAVSQKDYDNDTYSDLEGKVYIYLGVASSCPIITTFTISPITTISANIAWIADAIDYSMRWRKTGTVSWNYIYPESNLMLLSGLTICSTYEFQVQPNCLDGSGPWSAMQTFTTTCAPTCTSAPTGLFSNNITSTSAKLHWNPVAGAVSYKISYKQTTSPTWTTVNAATTVKMISGLTANTTYQYKVRAICAGVSSPFSTVANFTTLLKLSDENTITWDIFPNPGNGQFSLNSNLQSGEPVFVKIVDIAGAEVFRYDGIINENFQIDASYLSKGYYLIYITGDNFTLAKTIIIQ